MKHHRNGQASVLSESQLTSILESFSPTMRYIFAICRISEALQLEAGNIVGERIVFRATTTKTKTKQTREMKVPQKLKQILEETEMPE